MTTSEKYFSVTKYVTNGALDDIYFSVDEDVNEFPDSVISLKDDIELFIKVIQNLFIDNNQMYYHYYDRVFILADLAFNGKKNQCLLAQNGLEKIKNELIFNSGPTIRNNILNKFIKIVTFPIILSTLIFSGISTYETNPAILYIGNLLLVGIGSCVGCWLSLAFRTRSFEFKEILSIISDGYGIHSRVFFVIIFSISLALLMKTGVLMINLGTFSSNGIETDPFIALSSGLIMGFGEKIFVDNFQKKITNIKF